MKDKKGGNLTFDFGPLPPLDAPRPEPEAAVEQATGNRQQATGNDRAATSDASASSTVSAVPVPASPEPPPASVLPSIAPPSSGPLSGPLAVPAPSLPPVSDKPAEPRIFSVSQLGRIVNRSLERTFFEAMWVEGEVRGARPSASGHVYFCLKDENEDATIDVVLYRSQITPRARSLVKEGARLRVRGKPTYWSPRGKIQFVGERLELSGKGALLEALEQLKEKLKAEGLFDPKRKRPLPQDPRVIGVVTSATGAVIHDITKVAFRRGGARILLCPAQVQGAGAIDAIRRALSMLQKVRGVDVIVIGRGGGSADDLLAFNNEAVVRDVAACRVPVVSAVGHEVDVTLVDFAADARAATPSQAAEMLVPDRVARRRLLEERSSGLRRAMQTRLAQERLKANELTRAFGDPRLLIASAQQRVDEHLVRLGRLMAKRFAREQETLSRLESRLGAAHPRERIARDRAKVSDAVTRLESLSRALVKDRQNQIPHDRLEKIGRHLLQKQHNQLASLAGRLDAMSPLKVLGRGYAIVTHEGRAVRTATEVKPGDELHIRVAEGELEVEVKK